MTAPRPAESPSPVSESVGAAIARLLRAMPNPDATAGEQAEWLLTKANTLRLIASQTTDPDDAAQARALADAASRNAFRIARHGL